MLLPPNRTTDRLDEQELLDVLQSLRDGLFSARLSYNYTGTAGKIAAALNETFDLLVGFRTELLRTAEEIGESGRLGGQMHLQQGTKGAWREMAEGVNRMAYNVTADSRATAQACYAHLTAFDDRRAPELRCRGEVRELGRLVNEVIERAAKAGTRNAEQ